MREPLYRTRPVEPNPARFGLARRINDFIVLSEAFSNCYRVETSAGNVQINAGMGMEAPVIAANLDELTGEGSLHSLILTQGHVDHVGGVQYFRDRHPGLRVIASAGNAEHQAYDARLAPFRAARSAFAFADKFAAAVAHYAERGYTDFAAQDTPEPDVLVGDRLAFELGGITFEVIALPGAETNDSLIVWLPDQRICFTGNLFGCPFGHFPNLVTIRGDRYRDALVVAEAVETVRALEPDLILYGHHGPVEGRQLIQDELTALHVAILHVHDAVVEGMNAGADVHTLMQEIGLPEDMEVGEGYGKVSWSVRAIWESYAGWFHHRHTSELYSVPALSVAADVVALAGSEGLAARAWEYHEAGQHEQALHLLELLRDAGAGDAATLQLDIDVHRALLAASDNFWLSAWLKHRIRQCEAEAEGAE